MTGHESTPPAETRVSTAEAAAEIARDALSDEGCESIVATTPYRTRGTWVVPATSAEGTWRVHVDARTGATRAVRTRS